MDLHYVYTVHGKTRALILSKSEIAVNLFCICIHQYYCQRIIRIILCKKKTKLRLEITLRNFRNHEIYIVIESSHNLFKKIKVKILYNAGLVFFFTLVCNYVHVCFLPQPLEVTCFSFTFLLHCKLNRMRFTYISYSNKKMMHFQCVEKQMNAVLRVPTL